MSSSLSYRCSCCSAAARPPAARDEPCRAHASRFIATAIATVHRSVLCHLRLVLLSQLRVDLSAARRELTVNSRLANVLLARRITPLIVLTISNGKLLAHTIPSFLLYQLILFGTCELSIRAVCALWTSVVSTFSEIKAV